MQDDNAKNNTGRDGRASSQRVTQADLERIRRDAYESGRKSAQTSQQGTDYEAKQRILKDVQRQNQHAANRQRAAGIFGWMWRTFRRMHWILKLVTVFFALAAFGWVLSIFGIGDPTPEELAAQEQRRIERQEARDAAATQRELDNAQRELDNAQRDAQRAQNRAEAQQRAAQREAERAQAEIARQQRAAEAEAARLAAIPELGTLERVRYELEERIGTASGFGNARRVNSVSNDYGDFDLAISMIATDNLTRSLVRVGIKSDFIEALKAVRASGYDYNTLALISMFPLDDGYGNMTMQGVARATYRRSSVDRINFDGFISDNVYKIADEVIKHPAMGW